MGRFSQTRPAIKTVPGLDFQSSEPHAFVGVGWRSLHKATVVTQAFRSCSGRFGLTGRTKEL